MVRVDTLVWLLLILWMFLWCYMCTWPCTVDICTVVSYVNNFCMDTMMYQNYLQLNLMETVKYLFQIWGSCYTVHCSIEQNVLWFALMWKFSQSNIFLPWNLPVNSSLSFLPVALFTLFKMILQKTLNVYGNRVILHQLLQLLSFTFFGILTYSIMFLGEDIQPILNQKTAYLQ